MKKKDKPTDGLRDVEAVMEHLEDEGKKARRAQWLKENYGHTKQKGGSNENLGQSRGTAS